eukprot:scaffold23990_cov17-Tisochrysis_lutea.AAC.1
MEIGASKELQAQCKGAQIEKEQKQQVKRMKVRRSCIPLSQHVTCNHAGYKAGSGQASLQEQFLLLNVCTLRPAHLLLLVPRHKQGLLPCDNKETEVTQLIIGLKPEMTMRQYGHSAGAKLWRIQRSFAQGAHSTCRQCMTWMLGGASRQTCSHVVQAENK